jgi:hypothetical protein
VHAPSHGTPDKSPLPLQKATQLPLPEGAKVHNLHIDPFFENPTGSMEIMTPMPPDQVLAWYRQTLTKQGWNLTDDRNITGGWYAFVADRRRGHSLKKLRLRTLATGDRTPPDGTLLKIELESAGPLEQVEQSVMHLIDLPLGVLDDSVPGVCWWAAWMPLKLAR